MKKLGLAVVVLVIAMTCVLAGCAYKWKTFEEYSAMLSSGNEFNKVELDAENSQFTYYFEDPVLQEIRDKYDLEDAAGSGDDLSKAINILSWVSTNITHDGSKNVSVSIENGLTLLDYGFGKKENGMNCRQKAIVLQDCFRAMNMKSKIWFLMPKEPNSGDNHVANIVYIDSLNKWILIDPSWNAYFQDENGKYLDPFELRSVLAENKTVKFGENTKWNDVIFDENQQIFYKRYITKNLYWFRTQLFANANSSKVLDCAPISFDFNKWFVENLKLSKKYYKDKNQYIDLMEQYKTAKFSNYTIAEILKV